MSNVNYVDHGATLPDRNIFVLKIRRRHDVTLPPS